MIQSHGSGSFYLTDISEKDKAFDQHKLASREIARLYGLDGNLGLKGFITGSRHVLFASYEARIMQCGDWLRFWHTDDAFKLINANFCKVPYCPMCQFRRSLKWRAKFLTSLPAIQESFPNHVWLFLTLTQRNCQLENLRKSVQEMNAGWARLSKLARFPFLGCIKSLEVTRVWDWYDGSSGQFLGRHGVKWWFEQFAKYKTRKGDKPKNNPKSWIAKPTDEVHPHFHVLGLVSPSYFAGKNYIPQAEWQEMWKASLRVDYLPVVNIQRVKHRKPNKTEKLETPKENQTDLNPDILRGICETLKYTIKEQDLIGSFCQDEDTNSDWLKMITEQLYLLRRIEYKGCLKKFGKDVEASMDNLVKIDEDNEQQSEPNGREVVAYWDNYLKRYCIQIKEDLESE